MSMSSNILDLPDADYEDSNQYNGYEDAQTIPRKKHSRRVRFKENFDATAMTSDSIFEIIKGEINETNLLLLALFYVASTSQYSSIVSKFVYNNISTSGMVITVIKAVLLVIVFVVAKKYL